ncbi:Nicotinamidase [Eumeta japonica]|uniref:nicotinamidase n=1 Tax=Eumeta variegata TaxID=151549 RepID=A0A4C1YZT8_EUMVA|nr:Nicotinamidase [Eumeta japonica]
MNRSLYKVDVAQASAHNGRTSAARTTAGIDARPRLYTRFRPGRLRPRVTAPKHPQRGVGALARDRYELVHRPPRSKLIHKSLVVEPINRLLESVPFDVVFYSLDWHPPDHVSFIDNVHMRELHPSSPVSADKAQVYDTVVFAGPPPMKQRLWPRHCVQDSWGAELHKDLKVMDGSIKVYKGTNPEVDSYSVFWDNKKLTETTLSMQLRMRGATDIYICGLAYDVCVGATAVDALAIGYRTVLVDDASRGVDLADIEKTKANVVNNNGVIVNSHEVLAMVEGRDRRPELGYKLAMELKTALHDTTQEQA